MKKYILLLLLLLIFSSCEQNILLSDKDKEVKEKEKQTDQFTLRKTKENQALIYPDDSIKDDKLKDIRRPIINLNSDYAATINEHLKLKVSESISEIEKNSNQKVSMDYEVFENDGFISLLVKQKIDDNEKLYSYNIDNVKGGPVSIDIIDKKYNFNGSLQALVEKDIIGASEKNSGNPLQKFWDNEYKGFPQVYVNDNELYAISNSNSGNKIIKISKNISFNLNDVNPIYNNLNKSIEADLYIVALGNVKGFDEASSLVTNKDGINEKPSFLNFEDTSGRAYLIVPKKKNTLFRAKSLDKQSGILNEDMTNPNPFYLNDSYLIIFPEDDKNYKLGLELVYRADKVKLTEEDLDKETANNKIKISVISKDSE